MSAFENVVAKLLELLHEREHVRAFIFAWTGLLVLSFIVLTISGLIGLTPSEISRSNIFDVLVSLPLLDYFVLLFVTLLSALILVLYLYAKCTHSSFGAKKSLLLGGFGYVLGVTSVGCPLCLLAAFGFTAAAIAIAPIFGWIKWAGVLLLLAALVRMASAQCTIRRSSA